MVGIGVTKTNSFRRIFLTALLLFFVSLGLTSYSATHPIFSSRHSAFASGILRPFQSFHRYVRDALLGTWDTYVNLINTKMENRRLFAKVEVLRANNSRLLELKHENDRLRDLLYVKESTGFQGVVANVIAYEPSNWSHAITVDKGRSDNIEMSAAVLVGDGVVGQVIAVNNNTARVLLLTDPSSGIDAYVQASRVRGVVTGMGKFRTRWSYVLNKENVRVGDRIVSSGLDGVYPKGLIIGVVRKVVADKGGRLFKRVDVEPAVDFSRLESVLVVTDYTTAQNSSDETLEQPASAAVEPTVEQKNDVEPRE